MEDRKKQIVLIEPSGMIREGFRILISSHVDFSLAGAYPTVGQYADHRPSFRQVDAVILNPSIVDYEKRHNLRSILNLDNDTPLISLIYQYIDNETARQFDASIDIADDPARMFRKIRSAMEEHHSPASTGGDNRDLSDREKEILVSVAQGKTNKEIADTHNISVHTVISHRKNITRKTGIKTVSGLTVYALLNNLIDQADIE